MTASAFRDLPSVDRLLRDQRVAALGQAHSHAAVSQLVRQVLEDARRAIAQGAPCPSFEECVAMTLSQTEQAWSSNLRPLINATGVIIHTNLGRAPLSAEAAEAMRAVGTGYSNLEYDLEAGERGSRHSHVEGVLTRLTGAAAALVVNNNAAAVLLTLSALARGRQVIISRGQLVEIGGGFRIPEVLRQSGAVLVEVGTTNRTYISDYEEAITPETALLMRVHASNFRVSGFTHSASLEELVVLGHQYRLPVVDDLGSGTLLDTSTCGLAHEPMAQESIAAGADLVCFSGDKLLGGPQAGIIVGQAGLVERLNKHPLARAVRIDKLSLAGLETTLLHYLRGEATAKVPVWQMIAMPVGDIDRRARAWVEAIGSGGNDVSVVDAESTVGGGSLPGETLPTRAVAIAHRSPDELAARLRAAMPPVVGRIERGRLLLDPRTVLPEEDHLLLAALQQALVGRP